MVGLNAAYGPSCRAGRPPGPRSWAPQAVKFPPGLPRPHYDFRTTISYDASYSYRRPYAHRYYAYEEVAFTPAYAGVPYVTPRFGAPLLPGSSALPSYYV